MKVKMIAWLFLFYSPLLLWANTESSRNADKTTGIDSLTINVDLKERNGIYISPQPIVFTCQAEAPDKQAFRMVCIITTDTYIPVDSLVYTLQPSSSGKVQQEVSLHLTDAGFYRISVYAENGISKSIPKKFNIGYNPEQIISPPDPQPDFDEFWQRTRAELNQVKPEFEITLLKDKCSDTKNMYHVKMYSFGHVQIEGYYSVPKKPGKYPAIIRFLGYAANPRFPDPTIMPDFCEFILSIRGQGIQKATNIYGEWIVYGLPDKNTYYYRGAYMDLIRGVDFLVSRPEVDTQNIMAEGGSQGGALTFALCALDKRIKAAAPRIPFLSDFRDYFKICPWPRTVFEKYLKEHPDENWEKIYNVLSYFDIKNLTGKISCPLIMGVGLQDETCPPHTNFAGYNQVKTEKKYYVYPNQKHNVDDSWWIVRESFFREKIKEKQPGEFH